MCSSIVYRKIDTISYPPIPIPTFIALYSKFCGFIGITFTRPVFLFKIDHDNDTVTGILSHLNTRNQSYIDLRLIHRHRDRHCIKYVHVFALFTIIFLVEAP